MVLTVHMVEIVIEINVIELSMKVLERLKKS